MGGFTFHASRFFLSLERPELKFLILRTVLDLDSCVRERDGFSGAENLRVNSGRVAVCVQSTLYSAPTYNRRAPFGYEILHKVAACP